MRLATFILIGAFGLAAAAVSARAAPLAPGLAAQPTPNIVQVWGGCGRGFHPVPGHWSQWRGGWVPPHCAPSHGPYGPYAGWHPYWNHRYCYVAAYG
jgi:hypothetical protein